MKYIYMFDINEVLIDRYPALVANSIKQIPNSKIKFVFLYTENYYSKSKPKNIPIGSEVYYRNNINAQFLNSLTKKFPPIAFVCVGLRIPDIYLCYYFNNKNVKTYMIQHGIFTDKLERLNPFSFVIKRYSTIIKVLRNIYSLSKLSKDSFFGLFYDFYQIHFKNEMNLKDSRFFRKDFISNIAFIHDKSWNKYYTQKYGYDSKQFVYTGNPDFELVENLLESDFLNNSVCYICQSFVEDGRYSKDKYLNFLKDLKHNLNGKKIHLKLHPRSDLKLYESFTDKNFTISNDLINCPSYIGHYSSLIKIPFLLGRKVVVWNLDDHTTPSEFNNFATLSTNDWVSLQGYLNKKNTNEFKISSEMNSFLNSRKTPINIIANFINKNL